MPGGVGGAAEAAYPPRDGGFARAGRSASRAFALTLGLAALVALAFAGSASAADDPLGAVAQGGASTVGSAAPAAGGDAVAGNLAKVLQLAP